MNGIVGFSFTPRFDIEVTQLGIFDFMQNGLNDLNSDNGHIDEDGYIIGIFDAGGHHLVSATVTEFENPDHDFFVYALLPASEKLDVGELYYILADCGDELYAYNVPAFITSSGIEFISNTQHSSFADLNADIDDPLNNLSIDGFANGFFGPNLKYVSAVPVPGAIWLLGSGLIGLVGLKRRRG